VSGPAGGIPIRNIWHMLLYAWDLTHISGRFDATVEQSPSLWALIAKLLSDAVDRRLRRGLARGYVPRIEELDRVRGRIDVVRSAIARAPQRGRVICRFDIYDVDILQNRIVRSTLRTRP